MKNHKSSLIKAILLLATLLPDIIWGMESNDKQKKTAYQIEGSRQDPISYSLLSPVLKSISPLPDIVVMETENIDKEKRIIDDKNSLEDDATNLLPLVIDKEKKIKDKEIIDKIKDSLKEYAQNPLSPVFNSENIIKTQCKRPTKAYLQKNFSVSPITATPIIERGGGDNRPGKKIPENLPDHRQRVLDASSFPHSAHGVVFMRFRDWKVGDNYKYGTGTLISPYLVLTAAHNVYSDKYHDGNVIGEVEEIWFIPGMDGTNVPFDKIKVKKSYFPEEYKNTCLNEFTEDYALLVLTEPIGDKAGYFGLQVAPPDHIKELKITVTGYPESYPNESILHEVEREKNEYQMWEMQGEIKVVNENFIGYEIPTRKGNSGGGVWTKENENYYVWGVHVLKDTVGNICGGLNGATLLTKARYENLCRWSEDSILDRLNGIQNGITEINLERKCIEDYGINWLFNERFKIMCSITTLKLQHNLIGKDGAKVIAENLNKMSGLTCLDMEGNNIGNVGAGSICQQLESNKTISYLNLSNNEISDAKWIRDALQLNNTLTFLDLSHNSWSFPSIEIEGFFSTLEIYNKKILRLILGSEETEKSQSLIYSNINDLLARNKILHNTTLTSLDLSEYAPIGDRGSEEIANVLKKCTTLTELRFGNIKDDRFYHVRGLLARNMILNNTILTDLDLSQYAPIGDRGSEEIANILKKCTTLTELRFGNIKDARFDHVRGLLARNKILHNTTFTALDLSEYGQIGPQGAQLIADVLANNTILNSLDLSGSYIEDKGFLSITEALDTNTTLTSLNLRRNGIRGFIELLAKNTSLIELDLLDNPIGKEGAEILSRNNSLKSISLDVEAQRYYFQHVPEKYQKLKNVEDLIWDNVDDIMLDALVNKCCFKVDLSPHYMRKIFKGIRGSIKTSNQIGLYAIKTSSQIGLYAMSILLKCISYPIFEYPLPMACITFALIGKNDLIGLIFFSWLFTRKCAHGEYYLFGKCQEATCSSSSKNDDT